MLVYNKLVYRWVGSDTFFSTRPTLLGLVGLGFVEPMPRTQANFVALAFAYRILSYLRANPIGLARHVTSRDRVGWVGRSTRPMRSTHPVGLELLPGPRVKVGRVNPFVILQQIIEAKEYLIYYLFLYLSNYNSIELLFSILKI